MIVVAKDGEKTCWLVYADGEVVGVADAYPLAAETVKDQYAKDMGLTQEEREALFLDLKLGDWFVVDPKFSSIYRKRDYWIREAAKL